MILCMPCMLPEQSSNETTFNRHILNAVRIKGLSERKNGLINFKLRHSIISIVVSELSQLLDPLQSV